MAITLLGLLDFSKPVLGIPNPGFLLLARNLSEQSSWWARTLALESRCLVFAPTVQKNCLPIPSAFFTEPLRRVIWFPRLLCRAVSRCGSPPSSSLSCVFVPPGFFFGLTRRIGRLDKSEVPLRTKSSFFLQSFRRWRERNSSAPLIAYFVVTSARRWWL